MQRLWPEPAAEPLSDDDLIELYTADKPTWLRVNFATSLDGATELGGFSEGLSSPEDKRIFGMLRMLADALVVGAGTVRKESYRAVRLTPERREWRLAHGRPEYPTLVVVSGTLAIDPEHPALADAPTRPAVCTHAGAPAEARERLAEVADIIVHGDGVIDLASAVAELRERGHHQLLSEGGPHLFGALTAADLVDELCLTVAPILAGPGAGRITAGFAGPQPRRLQLRHILSGDGQLMLRHTR
jgi:riboflavin biosynthesis pyrimidine reductase